MAGSPEVVLETKDYRARIAQIDISYRLWTLEYSDGSRKDFKTPLGVSLEHVQKGDDVVVRATETLAIGLQRK